MCLWSPQLLKFLILKDRIWRKAAILKIEKSRHFVSRDDAEWVTQAHWPSAILDF